VPVAATFLAASIIPVTTAARADTHAAVTSKLSTPDRISSAKGVRGPHPGETTIKWKTSGHHTDLFKITTALSPFGSRSHRSKGRHRTSFVVRNSHRRSFTLSAAQTARAGAGLSTGRRLFFRIKAVNKRGSSSKARPYRHLQHATIAGQSSRMNGARLRFAEFNVRVQAADTRRHRWKHRQHQVARVIARAHPAVVGVQELMPAMWTGRGGGIGLKRSLRRAGAGEYKLTRKTAYFHGSAQDTRILYNTHRVRMTSTCRQSVPSCYISLPGDGHRRVAAYARFQDRASGQQFYFVSAHLTAGNHAATDGLRGRQARAITAGVRAIDGGNLPVVLATDANSSQTSKGVDAPHTALVGAGWYNTIAAARTEKVQYNSVNGYQFPQRPSPYGFGSMYDSILTLHMPGADLFKQVLTRASDHNLVFSDLRLPRS
jgi:endonuclease/exonuclease/phosphatase family metal-dependent hydrolase